MPGGRTMSLKIPILRIEGCLIASIQVALDDHSVVMFQRDLLQRVADADVVGVVIDISAVDAVDSFMARSLNDMAVAVQLLGARSAVVGIRPDVAITLVQMGLTIPHAITALNLEEGLRVLRGQGAGEVLTNGERFKRPIRAFHDAETVA